MLFAQAYVLRQQQQQQHYMYVLFLLHFICVAHNFKLC